MAESDVKRRFSYFCMSKSPDLCLGVSPGEDEAISGLFLQLKPYTRNYFKGTDQKKMRWDIVSQEDLDTGSPKDNSTLHQGFLRLEAQSPTFCVDRKTDDGTNLYVLPCSLPLLTTWTFDTDKGVLRLDQRPDLCATVTVCDPREDAANSCKFWKTTVASVGQITNGAIIHALPCFDSSSSYKNSQDAQTFQRELDCVAGCSPEMQDNGRCDEICNNPECGRDKGQCDDSDGSVPITRSPTAPLSTPMPSVPPSSGEDFSDPPPNISGASDTPNNWWLGLIVLLMCCVATAAFLLRRQSKRRAYARAFEPSGIDGGIEKLVDSNAGVRLDDDDLDEARFKTASAVALNQLRYHSRVANSSSTSSAHISSETVSKRRTEPTTNVNFQEVGLV